MAGDPAFLVDRQQQHIAVTVGANRAHPLRVTGLFTL
jgi:hypothetical protein